MSSIIVPLTQRVLQRMYERGQFFQYQPCLKERLINRRRRLVLWATVGTLASAIACSAIAAIACDSGGEKLPNSAPQITIDCDLSNDRRLYVSIGGLEAIPVRQVHAFEIFSFPNDGKLPVDDVHVQLWWETTHGLPTLPHDFPPIIRIGR